MEVGFVAMPSESPALDPEVLTVLRELEGGDPGFLDDILHDYVRQAGEAVASLRSAEQRLDGVELKAIAHTLKGTSISVGAYGVRDVCLELERAGAARDWATVAQLLSAADEEIARVETSVRAALHR